MTGSPAREAGDDRRSGELAGRVCARGHSKQGGFPGDGLAPRQGRWDKPPLRRTILTSPPSRTIPTTWGTYTDAVAAVAAGGGAVHRLYAGRRRPRRRRPRPLLTIPRRRDRRLGAEGDRRREQRLCRGDGEQPGGLRILGVVAGGELGRKWKIRRHDERRSDRESMADEQVRHDQRAADQRRRRAHRHRAVLR